MSDQRLTNEQKLEELYQIVTKQEGRRKAAAWFRTVKWLVILGLVYLIATNPEAIIGKAIQIVEPIIVSTAGNLAAKIMPQVQEQLNASLSGAMGTIDTSAIMDQVSQQLPQNTGNLSQEEFIRQQQEELIRKMRAANPGSSQN